MTQIKKFAWYGSSVAFAALLAVTLLVTGSAKVANADATAVNVTVGGTVEIEVDNTSSTNLDLVVASIQAGGTGQAEFTDSTVSGKQSIACVDDATTGAVTTCDRDTDASNIALRVNGTAVGVVLVQIVEYNAGVAQTPYTIVVTVAAAAPGAASVNITVPAATASIPAVNGTQTITATATNTAGAAMPDTTTQITFTTNAGTFDPAGCSNSTVPTQLCVAAVAGGAGQATVTLQAAGVPGQATVTATVGTVSGTRNVVFTGAVDALSIRFQSEIDPDPAVTTWVDASSPAAAADGNAFRAVVTGTDANGNAVSGVGVGGTTAVSLAFSAAGCATADGIGNNVSSAVLGATIGINPAGAAGTTCTVTATVGTGTSLRTASASFTVGAAPAASNVVSIVTKSIAPSVLTAVEVKVANAADVAVADGTEVVLVMTGGGVILDTSAFTRDGVASFRYVSPATGPVTAVASTDAGAASASGSGNIAIGDVTEPDGDDVGFTGEIFGSGVSTVVFNGGSLDDLDASAQAADLVSVWVTVNVDGVGTLIGYIVGAPDFVNAAFIAHFADGLGEQAVIVVK
ncbi:MAG: hypothetical protein M0R73_07650 [Dehalococcoidia bacterium]|nr:hypothetical protein [Dehalococcoidia bacterium]